MGFLNLPPHTSKFPNLADVVGARSSRLVQKVVGRFPLELL
jgi:hypothetical protein